MTFAPPISLTQRHQIQMPSAASSTCSTCHQSPPPPLTLAIPAAATPPLPPPNLARHYRSCPLRDHTCSSCHCFITQLYVHSRACKGCNSLACLHFKAQQCGAQQVATPKSLECVRTLMNMRQ